VRGGTGMCLEKKTISTTVKDRALGECRKWEGNNGEGYKRRPKSGCFPKNGVASSSGDSTDRINIAGGN